MLGNRGLLHHKAAATFGPGRTAEHVDHGYSFVRVW